MVIQLFAIWFYNYLLYGFTTTFICYMVIQLLAVWFYNYLLYGFTTISYMILQLFAIWFYNYLLYGFTTYEFLERYEGYVNVNCITVKFCY